MNDWSDCLKLIKDTPFEEVTFDRDLNNEKHIKMT